MELVDRLSSALTGHYEVERELGHGGMAIVFLARDQKYDRQVAIKVLRPELSESIGSERFLREIQIAAQLQHPHILPLYDSGEADGLLYYVMPYVEGESLRIRLNREKQLSVEEALDVVRDVAEALSYANSQGIIHRDIKPENILLFGDDAVVADFGIAHAVTEAGSESLTGSGVVIGTPAYMSPEQAGGETDLDGRSDVYALGCVLYEMLSGEPPFGGRTAQAILARHMQERVPSLEVVRPTIPLGLVDLVERSLAKVPADRFRTAQQLVEAVRACETGTQVRQERRPKRRTRMAVAALALLAVAVGLWRVLIPVAIPLDYHRVVVYPLTGGNDDPAAAEEGKNIATMIVGALDGVGSLRAIDGWDILDHTVRENMRGLAIDSAAAVARARGAGYFITGSIMPLGDSTTVMLSLRDTDGDSVVNRADRTGPVAEKWRHGVQAASELVPILFPDAGTVDFATIVDRDLEAVAHFFEGESQFRRARYDEALPHYDTALALDPLLTIAALRGAEAATWSHNFALANEFIRPALERASWTAPRYAEYAQGFLDYMDARADSSAHHLRAAIAMDSSWAVAWRALGDVYVHLLPRDAPLDSLAEAAFAEAHRLSPGFTPVLYHLVEFAARNGDVERAHEYLAGLRAAQADAELLGAAELMVQCVERSPSNVDWADAVREQPGHVFNVGYGLAPGGYQIGCSHAAFEAIWQHEVLRDRGGGNRRFNALIGLQSALFAEQRIDELTALLEDARSAFPDHIGMLYILDALAGAPLLQEARETAGQIRETFEAGSALSRNLWFLGIWEAGRGDAGEAQRVADTLAARAAYAEEGEDRRMTRLWAESIAGRAALARGDSAEALRLLEAIAPNGADGPIAWFPWESLAGERLAHAELLLADGRPAEALRVAQNFDAPAPVIYLLYLPASLSLRMRIAQELGDRELESKMRDRLVALGFDEPASR